MLVKSVLFLLAVLCTSTCYGGIHKCVDEYGHILYTDSPCLTPKSTADPVTPKPDTATTAPKPKANPVDMPVAEAEVEPPLPKGPKKYPYFYQLSIDLKRLIKRGINYLPLKDIAARYKRTHTNKAPENKATVTPQQQPPQPQQAVQPQPQPTQQQPPQPQAYQCDGRTSCPQMTSCEEATFFIKNCPNTQMDGDNDGIPCESQWCAKPL